MRIILILLFIGLSTILLSQQQVGNVFLANNVNPVIQVAQSDIGNYSLNDNNNINQISSVDNSDTINEDQNQSLGNISQIGDKRGIDFNFSMDLSSRSSSSFSSSSGSKSHKHVFTKKLKKLERNFYGKMGAHKKSKHLVDVCFNWKK